MKNIRIFIFLLLLTNSVKSQTLSCPGLDQFDGEWLYTNGQDSIKIYLRYQESYFSTGNGSIIGSLWGWHEYKKGNNIIESNYANRFMDIPTKYSEMSFDSYSILLLMPQCDFSKHKLLGNITDISQCNEMHTVEIQFTNTFNQLVWHQNHGEGYGFVTGCKGMTLPNTFVLIRQ